MLQKLLILGASGMLGHKAYQILSADFDTYATFKNFNDNVKKTGLFDENKVVNQVDVFNFAVVKDTVKNLKPNFILNCIGIVKQLKDAKNPKISIYINALFPNLLEELCLDMDCKLIHISTDCVFSGRKGNYTEEDQSDATDLYGRTKFLGEVGQSKNALTLRTSIIGRELFTQNGLIEWFLAQNNKQVNGYVNAIYTGLTTNALCNEIKRVVIKYPDIYGLYHISSSKISKYHLLEIVRNIYGLDIDILQYEAFHCDRSLNSMRYRETTGFSPPLWEKMIREMVLDPTPYNFWR